MKGQWISQLENYFTHVWTILRIHLLINQRWTTNLSYPSIAKEICNPKTLLLKSCELFLTKCFRSCSETWGFFNKVGMRLYVNMRLYTHINIHKWLNMENEHVQFCILVLATCENMVKKLLLTGKLINKGSTYTLGGLWLKHIQNPKSKMKNHLIWSYFQPKNCLGIFRWQCLLTNLYINKNHGTQNSPKQPK